MAQTAADVEIIRRRLELPTGIDPSETRALRRPERVALFGWHDSVAGNANGRQWFPAAIRRLSIEQRLALADDPTLDAAWKERERRRASVDVHYFTQAYGHVRAPVDGDDEAGGPPVPFTFWPRVDDAVRTAVGAADQAGVLEAFLEHLRIVVLKARQLGLTSLALHYGYWLQALNPATPSALILGLSQDGGYASKLLQRIREINELLPPFLRGVEDRETAGSKSEFEIVGRGRTVSLPGTPSAPRSYPSVTLAICDEWAFVRNGQAGPTMRAILPAARQVIAISSGDGGPDDEGWHQYFARLYVKARAGENEWTPIFLPDATRPGRTRAWREQQRDTFDTEEEFLSEHPETDDDALIGAGRDRYFSLSDVNAAVALGAEFDAMLGTDRMPTPVNETIRLGTDYGDVRTQGYVIWPLAGGGFYVPPSEVALERSEGSEIAQAIHERAAEIQQVDPHTGTIEPPLEALRYDNAGKQVNRGVMAATRERFSHQYQYGEARSVGVQFRKSKRETALYLRRLFKRTGQGRETGIIAISPHNPELVRQFRGLESAPDALWKKDDDHGPDAIVAGVSDIAKRHRALDTKGST